MTSQIVQDFKEGLGDGKLLIQRCNDCSHLALYPRYSCVACQSENLGWIPAEGSGVLHSFTVLRAGAPEGFEQDLPYALAVVQLDEGVQLLARLTPDSDGTWNHYQCDDRVVFSQPPAAENGVLQYAVFSPAWPDQTQRP
ncbi:MAG: hypothetical protein HOH70_06360 [Halieaceae bacterium]|jgi:uncharacterized OB-fold protein|nr:hypothetical protein [Halieaceae bacterium]MBT6124804.1 hypothetical protein [Halieaceae bacterium]